MLSKEKNLKIILQSLKAYIIFSVILGLFYPIGITLISQLFMKDKADGSLLKVNGTVVGSKLIGQNFTKPEYFHSRPSQCFYDASNSKASNFGPSSRQFIERVSTALKLVRKEYSLKDNAIIPPDMVLMSASGIDPHISVENAMIQAQRISKTRKISLGQIKVLIDENTERIFTDIWGRDGVNVLKLNLALDKISKSK